MGYKVSVTSLNAISLNESNVVAAILQNISIILMTRQQSIPLYRGFGLPMRFIDKPMHIAKPMMVAEIREAIAEYEPRATVLDVTFEEDNQDPGRLVPTVEVEIHDDE